MRRILASLMTITAILAGPAWAHDPIFGIGPHVLFKGGVEIAPEVHVSKQGDKRETELGVELTYGLTGDWSIGMELPYDKKEEGGISTSGRGDASLFTKYRFWRHDTLGVQQSMAVLVKVKLDTADDNKNPALGSGSRDTILGFTYGYEGRKWYRWAGIRHRHNGKNKTGLRRGDKWLLDLVGGIRFKPTGYREPDTVWLLELNGEYGQRAKDNGVTLANTGGTEWFLSPGIFWTKRNFAIKAGVQIPIASDLNGRQEKSDYRAKLILEWHL
ncbi:MAG TPA: transporter [Acidiferrobacteraceae bacterium]|nr:transporter [Acidiferrobacteraceae bacterium]HEX20040.1 transporter [Acidiferrobacteraceae bacterium]